MFVSFVGTDFFWNTGLYCFLFSFMVFFSLKIRGLRSKNTEQETSTSWYCVTSREPIATRHCVVPSGNVFLPHYFFNENSAFITPIWFKLQKLVKCQLSQSSLYYVKNVLFALLNAVLILSGFWCVQNDLREMMHSSLLGCLGVESSHHQSHQSRELTR